MGFGKAYSYAYDMKEGRAEGLEEGREEGRAEGGIEGGIRMLWGLVNDHIIDINVASARANMTVSEFEQKAKALMAEESAEYKP